MKTQVRKSVFETNSSSSHSLTLSKGDVQMMTFPAEILKAGHIEVGCREYGWEWDRLYKPENKLWYLVTAATHGHIEACGSLEETTAEMRETNAKVDQLCRVVEEHTGVALLLIPGSSGYIDHQSVGADGKAYESDECLRQFLFGPDAFIETGNDNSSPPAAISTDLGYSEDYYASFRAEAPKKGYVSVKLFVRKFALVTAFDVSLRDKPIMEKIQESGVVVKGVLSVPKNYSFYGESSSDRVMSDLADLGLRFSKNLGVSVSRKSDASSYAVDLDLEVMLPKATAKELEEPA